MNSCSLISPGVLKHSLGRVLLSCPSCTVLAGLSLQRFQVTIKTQNVILQEGWKKVKGSPTAGLARYLIKVTRPSLSQRDFQA